jgi:HK97 family phage major capsid protein
MDTKAITDALAERDAAVKALVAESEEREKKTSARILDLEQKLARRGMGNVTGAEVKSLGRELVEHPDFPRVQALVNARGKVTVELKTTTITSAIGSGAALVTPDFRPDPVLIQRRRLFVRDLVSPGSTISNAVTYPKQTVRDLNAGVVSEGVRKPQSSISFDIVSSPVRTIAHWTKAARQILDDAPQLQSTINSELTYGLSLAEEQEMLFGDGTGQHLLGAVTQSTAYETGRNVGGDTKFDTLAHGLAQSAVALLPSTGLVFEYR